MCYLIGCLCTKWNGSLQAKLRPAFRAGKRGFPARPGLHFGRTKEEGEKGMKFLTLLSLLLLIAVPPLSAQEKPKRLPGGAQVFGPVHTLRDENTVFADKEGQLVEGPRMLVMTFTFSEDALTQERAVYTPQGQMVHRTIETYDPDGRLQESRV